MVPYTQFLRVTIRFLYVSLCAHDRACMMSLRYVIKTHVIQGQVYYNDSENFIIPNWNASWRFSAIQQVWFHLISRRFRPRQYILLYGSSAHLPKPHIRQEKREVLYLLSILHHSWDCSSRASLLLPRESLIFMTVILELDVTPFI